MTATAQVLPRDALTAFNALLRQMEEEARLFERLAELLDSERDVLRSLHAPGLRDLNVEKERVLQLIDRVASARADSVEEIIERLGLDGEPHTLAALLERLPMVETQCLDDARRKLQRVAEIVRKRGEVSQRLLSVSLDAIHEILQLLRKESDESTRTYGGQGAAAAPQGTGMVVRHTV
jgi:flagellar biosynthesis/type III secretory pathway chaperone